MSTDTTSCAPNERRNSTGATIPCEPSTLDKRITIYAVRDHLRPRTFLADAVSLAGFWSCVDGPARSLTVIGKGLIPRLWVVRLTSVDLSLALFLKVRDDKGEVRTGFAFAALEAEAGTAGVPVLSSEHPLVNCYSTITKALLTLSLDFGVLCTFWHR